MGLDVRPGSRQLPKSQLLANSRYHDELSKFGAVINSVIVLASVLILYHY
jgi:hypothetical protein